MESWVKLAICHLQKSERNLSLSVQLPVNTLGGLPIRLPPFLVVWVVPVVVAEIELDMVVLMVTGGMFVGMLWPDRALAMISGSTMGASGSGDSGFVP